MSLKEFAEKFTKAEEEAWIHGNVDALDEVDDPNVVYHLQPPNPDVVGREAHKQYIIAARKAFTDIHLEWKYLTGEGNLFAISYNEHMMFTGELPGFPPPTGKQITINEICLCRLKKNKMIEVWMAGSATGLT
jgi:predicted ester cyclase